MLLMAIERAVHAEYFIHSRSAHGRVRYVVMTIGHP